MNKGGFSWKRFLGISRVKSKISRKTGIPLTKSGRKETPAIMKKISVIIIFLICCLQTKAQASTLSNDSFQLEAKMISELDRGADCGYSKFATVVEFQIINFSDKEYKMQNIGIIIRCPEFYGNDFFEVGKTYKLSAEIEKEKKNSDDFSYTIQNMKTLEKYKTENIFWAISISKL